MPKHRHARPAIPEARKGDPSNTVGNIFRLSEETTKKAVELARIVLADQPKKVARKKTGHRANKPTTTGKKPKNQAPVLDIAAVETPESKVKDIINDQPQLTETRPDRVGVAQIALGCLLELADEGNIDNPDPVDFFEIIDGGNTIIVHNSPNARNSAFERKMLVKTVDSVVIPFERKN